jgi:sulfide:quinone oxidoreductase
MKWIKMSGEINIIDHRQEHYYQPGYLFLPFDIYEPADIVKPIKDFIPKGVNLINEKAVKILPDEKMVQMVNGDQLHYDILIIATGCNIAPEEFQA